MNRRILRQRIIGNKGKKDRSNFYTSVINKVYRTMKKASLTVICYPRVDRAKEKL